MISAAAFPAGPEYRAGEFSYEIESAGAGANGTFLYKVTCSAQNPPAAADAASACAVHGVIFKGTAAAGANPAQTPLFNGEELTDGQKTALDGIFDGKHWKKYVPQVATGSMKIAKMKKGYRVEATVAVDKRKLRLDLEQAGVVEKLGSMFN